MCAGTAHKASANVSEGSVSATPSSALALSFTLDVDSVCLALLDESIPSELPPPPPPSEPDLDVYLDASDGALADESLGSSPVDSDADVYTRADSFYDAVSQAGKASLTLCDVICFHVDDSGASSWL